MIKTSQLHSEINIDNKFKDKNSVVIPMVADSFHMDHLNALEFVESLQLDSCDSTKKDSMNDSFLGYILVMIFSDESVQALNGTSPISSTSKRKQLVKSIKRINEVIVFDGRDEEDFKIMLERIRPKCLILGPDIKTFKLERIIEANLLKRIESKVNCQVFNICHSFMKRFNHNCNNGNNTDIDNYNETCEDNKTNKVVVLPMVADLLHVGHVNIVNAAAQYGKVNILLHSDDSVKTYKRHPIIPLDQRKKMLENLTLVHKVHTFNGTEVQDYVDALTNLRPDFIVHGNDWQKGGCTSKWRDGICDALQQWSWQCQLIEPPYTEGVSTTQIIQQCHQRYQSILHSKQHFRYFLQKFNEKIKFFSSIHSNPFVLFVVLFVGLVLGKLL